MKGFFRKISNVMRQIFGWGIMIALLAGGLSFFGYVVALIIGGDTATAICVFLYKQYLPVVIYVSTVMILLGVVSMYLAGEYALTPDKKKAAEHEGEH